MSDAKLRSSRATSRITNAKESLQMAASDIGPIHKGMHLFLISRGQWSMIDAILHVIDQVGKSELSVWTWTAGNNDLFSLTALKGTQKLTHARLIIDFKATTTNAPTLKLWTRTFGPDSIRYVINHAKISTIASETGLRVVIRGSMNLNCNPRFEQLDITEGGPEYELINKIENSLPVLPADCSQSDARNASQLSDFGKNNLAMFQGVRAWTK